MSKFPIFDPIMYDFHHITLIVITSYSIHYTKLYDEPIGVSVTVRGEDAKELLKRLFEAKGNQVKGRSFDNFGNYSFGINEHIDIPGVKYDPKVGIMGLGVSVTLTRPGYRNNFV